MKSMLAIAAALVLAEGARAFQVPPGAAFQHVLWRGAAAPRTLSAARAALRILCSCASDAPNDPPALERRKVVQAPISLVLASVFGVAAAPSGSVAKVDPTRPVVVIGAGGGTGKECVNALLRRGLPVRSLVRAKVTSKGEEVAFQSATDESLLEEVIADVTSKQSMAEATKGSRAVIFAASASKKGGDPQKVDYQGLLNVAESCLENKVERLVVVSSGGVSRPDSAVYKFLNLFGKIMYWKIKGEDEMRALYREAKAADPSLKVSFTVVRPGGLTTGPATGVETIELNQKDTKSGRIARADVAEICVECLNYPAAADTTFECYYADTAKPLNDVGLSNIFKKTTSEAEAAASATGLERRGKTWKEIFTGLKPAGELG
jgi:putative NADH-flavin reductase